MTESGIASRYAHALVDALTAPNSNVDAGESLGVLNDFHETVGRTHDLQLVMQSPIVTSERKRAALKRIADAMQMDRLICNFLFVLTDHRRLSLLGDIVRAASVLLDERLGFMRAFVTAAAPLNDEEQSRVAQKLEEVTGRRIRVTLAVDPELLGGIIARVGSKVYDGSVKGRLRLVAERLAVESR